MLQRPDRRRLSWRRIAKVALQLLLALAVGTTMLLTFQFTTNDQKFIAMNRLMPDLPSGLGGNDQYAESVSNEEYFDDIGRNPAILVLTHNRADYLRSVLDRLNSLPRRSKFGVYVSQDGTNSDISHLLNSYSSWVTHIRHDRKAALHPEQGPTAYLAQHYRWALDQLFLQRNHSHVVVLEDDLLLSEDALILFEQTAPLLDLDPSIWCVSSWNDLGLAAFALDNRTLFRTDFFPGLVLHSEKWFLWDK